jgi:hypothetical protein
MGENPIPQGNNDDQAKSFVNFGAATVWRSRSSVGLSRPYLRRQNVFVPSILQEWRKVKATF